MIFFLCFPFLCLFARHNNLFIISVHQIFLSFSLIVRYFRVNFLFYLFSHLNFLFSFISASSTRSPPVTVQFAILFGLYVCYLAGYREQMPLTFLQPLQQVGLFVFRSMAAIRFVFWSAIAAHVIEALIAAYIAIVIKQTSLHDAGFWTIQTLLYGYPSLRLLRKLTNKGQTKHKAQ
jgi:hypothetical protein